MGYSIIPGLVLSAGGLFTGAKTVGGLADVRYAPLWTEAVVHPTVGLMVPLLVADKPVVGVAPHLGIEVTPIQMVALEVEIPLLYLLNTEAAQRALYPLIQGGAAVRF